MQQVYELILPETVEGVQLHSDNEDWVSSWCRGKLIEEVDEKTGLRRIIGIYVPTLKGVQVAHYTDYIFRKRCGDFVVSRAPEFERKYKLVK